MTQPGLELCVDNVGPTLLILLPRSLQWWNFRPVPPNLMQCYKTTLLLHIFLPCKSVSCYVWQTFLFLIFEPASLQIYILIIEQGNT